MKSKYWEMCQYFLRISSFYLMIFFLFFPAFLKAQTAAKIRTIGVKIGAAFPDLNDKNVFSAGFNAEIGNFVRLSTLNLFFDYWRSSWSDHNQHHQWTAVTCGLAVKYDYEMKHSRAKPFIGAGLGFQLNFWEHTQNIAETTAKQKKTGLDFDLCSHVLAGINVPFKKRTSCDTEIKYVLTGKADYLSIWLGLKYEL